MLAVTKTAVTTMAAEYLLMDNSKRQVEQVLAKLYSNTKEAILSDLLGMSTLSKVPQLVLTGMQWLSKNPTVIAAGRFKDLVMAAELMPGTFLFASLSACCL